MKSPFRLKNQYKKYLAFIGVIVFVIFALFFAYKNISLNLSFGRNENLQVYFLDVGQGDAIFIKSPSGKTMLVDAGPQNNVLKPLSKRFLFRKKHIDVLLASHPDADHVGGFVPVMQNYNVDVFVESAYIKDNQILAQVETLVNDKVQNHVIATEGTVIDLGGGVTFKILAPNDSELIGDSNNASIVGKLIYGNNSFLLTGDASISNEIRLVKDYGEREELKADVLKLGHHGSRTSSAIEFLQNVNPQIAIISAGKNNRYGHPHPEVLNRLKNVGIPYVSTTEKGTVCLQSDGEKVSECK
ncbi:MAG: MBL fold metallo-hydrolase [Candidatus Pacebacteria bacterium]|nr:MBL fold metallo-hydrolase [Candidatus Paceibacterota bacterium]